MSAVSLWTMAGGSEQAADLAKRYLGEPISTGFARELHELLDEVQRHLAERDLLPHMPEERAETVLDELRRREEEIAQGRVPLAAAHPVMPA